MTLGLRAAAAVGGPWVDLPCLLRRSLHGLCARPEDQQGLDGVPDIMFVYTHALRGDVSGPQ